MAEQPRAFDVERIRKAVQEILLAVGEDINREGLRQTPDRVARMYAELLGGTLEDPRLHLQSVFTEKYDEIVLLRDIPFYSICEHHMLPFIGKAHVAYIPDRNRITGLSKLARVVELYARRLQVQERMTTQIAECLMQALSPKGVMVVVEAEHLCMTMRGVLKPGSLSVTSVVRGIFRDNPATRAETMALIQQGK